MPNNFWVACISFKKIFFPVFKESAQQYLKKIQVQVIAFNKKAAVKISRTLGKVVPHFNCR